MKFIHKKEKQNKNNDPLIHLMIQTVIGVLVCTIGLASMTWAWFTASVDTPAQTIQSATYSTAVLVYEVNQPVEENDTATKTLVMPQVSEEVAPAEGTLPKAKKAAEDESVIITGETAIWELSPEKTYEVVLKGVGTATQGYCKVALSHTVSGTDKAETQIYSTPAFEKDNEFKFTYNTGGFSDGEGVTATQYMNYVENTEAPTLAIASYWGKPAEPEEEKAMLMSLRDSSKKIMLLSDGDVLGLAPIPCPEAKAETEVALEGFEIQEGAVISAEEDYKISLTLKEGYEMPGEVVVNIGGKDYVISTSGAEANLDAPYYDVESGVLTVPSTLLSDGVKVAVKATATQIPVVEETEEPEEEIEEEVLEDEVEETTETEEEEEEEEEKSSGSSGGSFVADDPSKKEEDVDKETDQPDDSPAGGDGDDDDDSSDDKTLPGGNGTEEIEKADVKLNLSQLTINLEETKIPTNADLVLTLAAKEDMKLPEQIVITLDKTIRDEETDEETDKDTDKDIKDEEIVEDKTEYVIYTTEEDSEKNPEGFEFNPESGELTISSELLAGVREITIADVQEDESDKDKEDEEMAEITFEVKNLTFDFTDDEIVTDEDVVITFTAGEGYELPETIVITIDGVEYVVYTSEEDSEKNPEGFIFDIETGTLTISKDLLEEAEAITIAAEGIKKEDTEESEDNEGGTEGGDGKDPEGDGKEPEGDGKEPEGGENKDPEGGSQTPESGDTTDPEGGTDTPEGGDTTDPEGGTQDPEGGDTTDPEGGTETPEGGENTGTTTPETDPDNPTDGEDDGNGDNTGDGDISGDNTEGDGEIETPTPDVDPSIPTTPETGDNTEGEQGGENVDPEGGEGTTDNGSEETDPDVEIPTVPTEPTIPTEPSGPVVTPEAGGNDSEGNETGSADNGSTESGNNSGNDNTESDAPSESTTPDLPTTSTPDAGETTAPSISAPESSEPSTESISGGVSQEVSTTTSSEE